MVSKIGKIPVAVPSGVTVNVKEGVVSVAGPKGNISLFVPRDIRVVQEGALIRVVVESEERALAATHGLFRALLANAVSGVTSGWGRTLELVGTGYRASLSGENLSLSVGFSHSVVVKPPEGISFSIDANKVTVLGVDRQKVGKVAAEIRAVRPPEPYKGKGIKYVEEKLRRKAGKAAKAVGTTAGK